MTSFIRKTLIFTFLMACSNVMSLAQSKTWNLGVGLGFGLPAQNICGLIFNPDARFQYAISHSTGLTLTAGFNDFLGREHPYLTYPDEFNSNSRPTRLLGTNIFPIKLGAKFNFKELFIQPEAGIAIAVYHNYGNPFVYALNLGVGFSRKCDLILKYQGFEYKTNTRTKTDFVSLGLAYHFKKKENKY